MRHSSTNLRYTKILAVATLLAIANIIRLSLNPDNYFFYQSDNRLDWTHPTLGVTFICLIVTTEGLFAWLTLFGPVPKSNLARRLTGLILFAPWVMLSSMFVVHAPVHVLFHILWVWAIAICLLIGVIFSFVGTEKSNDAF